MCLIVEEIPADQQTFLIGVGSKWLLKERGRYQTPLRGTIVNDNGWISSSGGLHFSSCGYWDVHSYNEPSVLLAAKIKSKDIICCQEGKVRVKACVPLGIVT